jgi:N-acetylmuramoyl-L-alanine amidase
MVGGTILEGARRSRPFVRLAAVLATATVACGGWCDLAAASDRYRVQPGDTLTAIAAHYHTSVSVLSRLNKLDPDEILLAGARLRLPQARPRERLTPYVVRLGDTLGQIAVDHGLSVARIASLNRIDPADVLLAGRRLMLPAGPSRQTIQASIRYWADHYRIPHALALALAWQESGHQAQVVSRAGAIGVMQVMPGTWTYVETTLIGRSIPRSATGNVRVGLSYLRHLLNTFGNTQRALAAYYQGERSVQTSGIHRLTRRYIANILAIAGRLRSGATLS